MDVRVTSFGVSDAKARFSELLDRVEQGETITVNKHGRPIAKLVPANAQRSVEQRKAHLREYLEAVRRRGETLGKDLSIRQLINEGREAE